jgi:hypothetical protein
MAVVLAFLAVYVVAFGWSIRGFPAPNPWIKVNNNGPSPVTVQLWEGGPVYRSDCGTKQGFSAGERVPPSPWHTRLRDSSTGRLLAEAWSTGVNGWMTAYVSSDGRVEINHINDRGGSGPVPMCSNSVEGSGAKFHLWLSLSGPLQAVVTRAHSSQGLCDSQESRIDVVLDGYLNDKRLEVQMLVNRQPGSVQGTIAVASPEQISAIGPMAATYVISPDKRSGRVQSDIASGWWQCFP